MSETTRHRVFELFGLGLASFSVLGSQIAMTRILSLKYAANQTFLVVSFAVLGLAFGAGIVHYLGERGQRRWPLAAAGMLLFALTLAVLLASFYLNLSPSQQIVLVPLPFLGVGLCIADVLSRRARQAGYYYAVDLTGAAIGAFGAAPLLDRVAAPSTILLFCLTGLCAAALLWLGAPPRALIVVPLGAVAAAAFVVALGLPGRALGPVPIYPDRIKDMLVYLSEGQETRSALSRPPFIEQSRWSAFGRTDVVNDVDRRQSKMLFVDGAAGSPMFVAHDRLDATTRVYLKIAFGPSVALSLTAPEDKRTALAIGSGGGRDVLACRLAGVGHVTAVELNPDVVDIVREEAEFNGGLYASGGVTSVVEEGRHFLRGSAATYDVILLSIPVTKRGEGYGGFALSESYLFTRESIREYLDHLTPHGQLLIVCHTRQEVGRLLNTYLHSVSDTLEPAQAMRRVAVFGEQLLTVLIRRDEAPDAYWQRLAEETRRLEIARPDDLFWYVPGPGGSVASSTLALAAVASGAASAVVFPRKSSSTFEPDMSAVTDDRPFFYFFTGSLPPMVSVVMATSAGALLVMLLWGVVASSPSSGESARELVLWRLAVAGLGIGFMLAEIAFIQRFVFWFGRPTFALGLLLGTLLMATGIGSTLAGAIVRGDLRRTWPVVVLIGVCFVLLFGPAQMLLFRGATGTLADALMRSIAITIPLGLLMGVPFPMLLTAAGRRGNVSVAWLWGINGIGSVVGSSAAVGVAMLVGYSMAMRLAGVVYLATAAIVFALSRRTHPAR